MANFDLPEISRKQLRAFLKVLYRDRPDDIEIFIDTYLGMGEDNDMISTGVFVRSLFQMENF